MATDGASQPPKSASLHPAYSVTNIQTKIRTLDGTKVTYTSWIKLFRLHAVAYKVSDHIDGTPAPTSSSPDYEAWKELDALVLQWIYSTVSDDFLLRILETDTTAQAAWSKLEKICLSNKKARAAALETKFCNLTLTACSSVDDYYVDQPVSESRLVLQLVRGLPAEYNTTASLINQNGVDWDQAITMLNDEVLRIEARQGSSSTVLVASAAPAQQHPPNLNTGSTSQSDSQTHSFRGRGRGRGNFNRKGNRGRGGGRPPFNTQYMAYPPWAWWTTPPCPYPTQTNWRQAPYSAQSNVVPQQAHCHQLHVTIKQIQAGSMLYAHPI